MTHLNVEDLVSYAEGQAQADKKTMVQEHLSSCGDCAEISVEIRTLISRLEQDAACEPPLGLLHETIGLFQPILQPAVRSRIRKIIGILVSDTWEEPALAGLRHVGAPPRQLLFHAGDVDVDVKIESMEANDRITLVGQVLSDSAKFFDNTPVKLESHGIVRYKTRTNVVGEFTFDEVPKDTYHLTVDLPEGQITLFCVHRTRS
jgi:hypothetical protein